MTKDNLGDESAKTRLSVKGGCALLVLFVVGFMVFNVGRTLVTPHFMKKECDLPHSAARESEFEKMIVKLANDFRNGDMRNGMRRGENLENLYSLSPNDQLYVIHNSILRIGGVFNNEKNGETRSKIEYKISPIYLTGKKYLIDPQVYFYPWASIHVGVSNDIKNQVYPRIVFWFPGFSIDGTGQMQSLIFEASDRSCPARQMHMKDEK